MLTPLDSRFVQMFSSLFLLGSRVKNGSQGFLRFMSCLLTTCWVWIYFQTRLGNRARFLKAKVPIKTIETVAAAHSFIKDLLASLFPRWKTSKVLYLLAMFVAVPALFSWGNSKSGTSWPRNSQSRSQPSPTLNTSKFSGRTKLFKNAVGCILKVWEASVYLDCGVVSCVGVHPDRGTNIGPDGLGHVHAITGGGQHHVVYRQFIWKQNVILSWPQF